VSPVEKPNKFLVSLDKNKCWILGDPGKTKLGFFGELVKTKGCWVYFYDPVKPKCRGFEL